MSQCRAINKDGTLCRRNAMRGTDFCASHTPEIMAKVSRALKGRELSENHKEKLSDAHKGKRHSEDTRRKIGEAKRGLKDSEETMERKMESQKRSYAEDPMRRKRLSKIMKLKWKDPRYRFKQRTADKRKGEFFLFNLIKREKLLQPYEVIWNSGRKEPWEVDLSDEQTEMFNKIYVKPDIIVVFEKQIIGVIEYGDSKYWHSGKPGMGLLPEDLKEIYLRYDGEERCLLFLWIEHGNWKRKKYLNYVRELLHSFSDRLDIAVVDW